MKVKQVHVNPLFTNGKSRARVLIIYTGGTFGMTYDETGALVPFDFASIVEHLPTLRNLGLDFTVFAFEQPIDSSNVSPEHWKAIADLVYEYHQSHDGFVILHGTDTMAYSASALSFMLEGLARPVILTGAQLPIIDPRSDARENLITALEIAAASEGGRPIVPEVCIYFDYQLLRGNRSKKVESMQFDAFDSGNYPPLAKAGVKIDYNHAVILQPQDRPLKIHDRFDTSVAILKIFPGMSQLMVEHIFSAGHLKAIILETYGSGNAPTYPWLTDVLTQAVNRGILVVNISQCPGGMVVQGKYETSRELKLAGVISGRDMTVEAAVTKLMILLGEYPVPECGELFQKNMAGEISNSE